MEVDQDLVPVLDILLLTVVSYAWSTVNSEIFARALFSHTRSFLKIKTSRNGKITLSFIDKGKPCLSRNFFTSLICLLMLFAKIEFSRKFPNLVLLSRRLDHLWEKHLHMGQYRRFPYLLHQRAAKAPESLPICTGPSDPSLPAHIKYGSRGKCGSTARHPASDSGVICMEYCKFGNFCKGFIFAYAKFPENKTLTKWQNHSVVY